MPRAAVALASTNARSDSARSDVVVRSNSISFRPRRMHLVLVALAVVSVWLVFVFARALGDVDRATARQAQITSEASTLQARLDADRRELQLVQTDAFQRLQARAYGLGAAGEQAFALAPGAPSPAPITPLGGARPAGSLDAPVQTPLDAWLQILFGH